MSVDPVATIMGNSAQNNATDTNARNVRNTNTANMLMQLMARGQSIDARTAHILGLPPSMVGRSSSILPYYMGDIESNLGMKAGELSQAMQGITPQTELGQYQSILDRGQPGFDAATKLSQDIVTGAEGDKMVAEGQPAMDARMGVATGKRNAALESLKQTLNDIDAIQSKKGFAGDSLGNRMMKFNATKNINTQAAGDIQGANFENAVSKAALQQQARNFRVSNLGIADSTARGDISRLGIPTSAAASRFNTSMGPLSFFNLGPHNYTPNQNLPTVGPQPGIAQLFSEGVNGISGAAGNSMANYFAKQRWGNNSGGGGSLSPGNDYSSAYNGASGNEAGYTPASSGGAYDGAMSFD